MILNDGSAREWQRAASQWTPGKNFDGTMPIGPEVVTTDELDASAIQLTTTLNGEVMQSASTAQMIFDIPRTIEYLSSFTTLRPGDVIATGTPGGVGFARTPPVWLQPGDLVEVTIEGVGRIANRVAAEERARDGWPWIPPTPDNGSAVTAPPTQQVAHTRRRACSGRRSTRRARLLAGTVVVGAVLAAGCGSSSSSGSASGGSGAKASAGSSLTVADVAPFTGTDAALGPTYLVSCDAATNAINAAGGVLGHKLNCKSVDTRGDPADAVPAVHQMYASTGNLAFVIGCTSDEAASVVPIFASNKTVSFCMTGQSEFDHVKFPYFYRLVPPDLSESYAMVAMAKNNGYKKVALAFGNDIGSQTFIAPAIAAIKKAGLQLVVQRDPRPERDARSGPRRRRSLRQSPT